MIQQGLPPENTRLKKTTVYVGIFATLGIILFLLVTVLRDSLLSVSKVIDDIGGLGLVDAVMVLLMIIPISLVQTFILKDNIPASKILLFIGTSSLAGFVAGFIGGSAIIVFGIVTIPLNGILLGALIGCVLGFISGLLQSRLMKNKAETSKWLVYSIASNLFVWMIGWAIGWAMPGLPGVAVSAAVMMLASGIALSVFLNSNHIEF